MKYQTQRKEDGCIAEEVNTKNSEEEAMRRRDKRISDTLHQVHKPYHSRPVENTVSDAGTILFDLS